MNRGFIYELAKLVIQVLYWGNAVEWLKKLYGRSGGIPAVHWAIDIYIVLKYVIVGLFWIAGYYYAIGVGMVVYLLFYNTYTYFYYHVWVAPYSLTRESKQRRLVNFFLAFGYAVLCYGYLYAVMGQREGVEALLFSFECSMGMGSGNGLGLLERFVVASQLFNTFLFVAIILVNTVIPETARLLKAERR